MKQLAKLGSQGAKVLTDGQMKTVTGGKPVPYPTCRPDTVEDTCSAGVTCYVTDSQGYVRYGSCDTACRCHLFADPGGPPVLPDL